MSELDIATLLQKALRVGLLTPAQYQEAMEEAAAVGNDVERTLRFLERQGILTPWQSSKLLKGDSDGYFLGGYRVLYKIAAGSFGRVYRGDDPTSGRVVAIKVLRNRWRDDPARIELFEREGKVGVSLRHPNIVEILQVNHDPATGAYFIVMEFVEGGNLREILAIQKKFEPAQALKILEDAASGLSYAYSRGVTHRDMKLTNILISSSGVAKLVDFGLAKVLSGGEDEVQVERTVDYAGLEKATGVRPGDVRSDIYFLGCVAYEMLTGRPPLETTRNKQQRMQKHRFDTVAPLKPEEVNAPPSVIHLVETMMALNPTHRYQTPAQLLDAIKVVRAELEGRTVERTAGPKSVFVVEADTRLQDAIREGFKELGYKVFMAADPVRAHDRFRTQPYDAIVVDAGTTGHDGMSVFEQVLTDAYRQNLDCAGILLLNQDQSAWADRVVERPKMAVMVRPATLKQLARKLQELAPTQKPA